MINLSELEQKINGLLESETPESLTNWLINKRTNMKFEELVDRTGKLYMADTQEEIEANIDRAVREISNHKDKSEFIDLMSDILHRKCPEYTSIDHVLRAFSTILLEATDQEFLDIKLSFVLTYFDRLTGIEQWEFIVQYKEHLTLTLDNNNTTVHITSEEESDDIVLAELKDGLGSRSGIGTLLHLFQINFQYV